VTTTTQTPALVDSAWLAEQLDGGSAPRVLDVRTPAEFETAHIRGSYNVPLDTLREHRDDIARHLDEDVVLVCRSGQRAQQAEQALASTDLSNVKVLHGGITAWQGAGHPVKEGHQRWDLERQVRLVAGSVVLTSIVASAFVPAARWVAGGIGGGLTFAALSNSCAMGALLSKLPYNRPASCDPQFLVDQLAGGSQPR
jgi:rhodanese-related sulfurtransferase